MSRTEWKGEATVVDLGEGRYVFALLDNPQYLATGTFKHLVIQQRVGTSRNAFSIRTLYPRFEDMREIAPVKSEHNFPTLVTFDDGNDPASIGLVDPHDVVELYI